VAKIGTIYACIIGLFAIVTYYADKAAGKRKKGGETKRED